MRPSSFPQALATSRYQARDLVSASGLVPVRITRGHPRFRLGYELGATVMSLAPSKELFARRESCDFAAEYREQLDRLGIDVVRAQLQEVSARNGGRGLVLLCYEDVSSPSARPCHRRVFASWWEDNGGGPVPELGLDG